LDESDHYGLRRVAGLVLIAAVVEAALFLLARRAPAFAALFRPAYAVVLVAFAVPIWRAARGRGGVDRRRAERREGERQETGGGKRETRS